MRLLILIFTLFITSMLLADEPMWSSLFKSRNQMFELQYISGGHSLRSPEKWKLVDKSSGKIKYILKGKLGSRKTWISNDGNYVTVIDTYSEQKPSKTIDVLQFYEKGHIIKKYNLGQLLRDHTNISSSASHFQWCDFRYDPDNTGRLILMTYELTTIEFNFRTGQIINKYTDPILSKDALYVYGMVKKLSNRKYEMEICHVAFGNAPKNGIVQFEADKEEKNFHALLNHSFPETIIITNSKCVAVKDYILNECNFKKSK